MTFMYLDDSHKGLQWVWHALYLQSFGIFLSGCLPVKNKVYHIFI